MKGWTDVLLEIAGDRRLWEGKFQFGDWLDPDAPPDLPARGRRTATSSRAPTSSAPPTRSPAPRDCSAMTPTRPATPAPHSCLHHPAHAAAAMIVTGMPIGNLWRLGDARFGGDHEAGDGGRILERDRRPWRGR